MGSSTPGSPGSTTAGNKNEVSPPSSSPKWERLVFESRLFYLGVSAGIFLFKSQSPDVTRGVGVKHLICSQLLKWKEWLYLGSVSVSSCISLCFLILFSSICFVVSHLSVISHLKNSILYSLSTFFICCDLRPPLAISWWTISIRQLLHFFLRPRGRGEGVSIHHPVHLRIRGSWILLAQKSLEGIRRWANPGSSRQHPSRPRHRRKEFFESWSLPLSRRRKKNDWLLDRLDLGVPWPVKGDLKEDRGNRKVETKSWF